MATVKRNHEAPDLWAAVRAQAALPDAASRAEQSKPFSPREIKQLEAGLEEIERYIIATQPLDPDSQLKVKNRFQYLREAAQRTALKIDWLNIFVGQMFAFFAEGILHPSAYQVVMAHAASALTSVFQLGLKLLS